MQSLGEASAFAVTLHFDRELASFLPKRNASGEIVRKSGERTSVKDVIESCGVPHTEVHAICCDGCSVDFAHQVSRDAEVRVYGQTERSRESCRRCREPA